MDKDEFIEKAPLYYALAIAVTLSNAKKQVNTIGELDNQISTNNVYLEKAPLIDAATKLLSRENAMLVIADDFGPALFRASEELSTWLDGAAAERFPLFRKFRDAGKNITWLRSALKSVNKHYEELGVTSDDFENNAADAEWDPSPLNRDDQKLNAATEALDTAIHEIEGDNGYAVHYPGEREYVLSNLKNASQTLKSQPNIYWLQLKNYALEPLNRVIRRFGTAAVGVASTAAREAILEWLKEAFSRALDWL
jgi:hypothetical protein